MSELAIPPAVDMTWVDNTQAATDAALILRLNPLPSGPDFDRLLEMAVSAGALICLHLDRLEPIPGAIPGTPPALLRTAHANVTVELWRRKDAPSGGANSWAPDQTPQQLPTNDPLYASLALIEPYRNRWGIA